VGQFCLPGCVNDTPSTSTGATLPDELNGKDREPMVTIPAGEFWMGSSEGVAQRFPDKWQVGRPVHQVRFLRSFAIARYETTFEEYDRFAQATGRKLPYDAGFGRGQRPVINVSWNDARDYAKWLSDQTGKRYRLPAEAEWEYVARSIAKNEDNIWAGTSDKAKLKDYAVFSTSRTEPVGSKNPNRLALYDMSGNVWEWVDDCWHDRYYDAPKDGTAWHEPSGKTCDKRVIRGGSWGDGPEQSIVTIRSKYAPVQKKSFIGFRLVQDLE
jgi:formylglycine-generating enzyme required for sulfatase activity